MGRASLIPKALLDAPLATSSKREEQSGKATHSGGRGKGRETELDALLAILIVTRSDAVGAGHQRRI